MCTKFWLHSLKERDYSEDLGIDGWTSGLKVVDWIDLAQDWDRWRALGNEPLD
jgi:hypothetical protein